MPKDVASGLVNGYQVPRCTMRGQRNQWLAWEFKVPKWACLGNDVEFSGYLKSLNDQLIVDMIQVDVVQEELYIDGARYLHNNNNNKNNNNNNKKKKISTYIINNDHHHSSLLFYLKKNTYIKKA